MFEHYISLGVNCEAAFQFRRVLQLDHSGFFSWNVTEIAALISLLSSNFAGILRSENLRYEGNGSLIRDLSHNYHFHWVTGDFDEIHRQESASIKQHVDKAEYLIHKFRSLMQSKESKALFYVTNEPAVFEPMQQVCDVLERQFEASNFKLIVVQDEHSRQQDWLHPHLINRYIARFAPWSDATDGHVKSWDAIFREFPHKNGLTLAGF